MRYQQASSFSSAVREAPYKQPHRACVRSLLQGEMRASRLRECIVLYGTLRPHIDASIVQCTVSCDVMTLGTRPIHYIIPWNG